MRLFKILYRSEIVSCFTLFGKQTHSIIHCNWRCTMYIEGLGAETLPRQAHWKFTIFSLKQPAVAQLYTLCSVSSEIWESWYIEIWNATVLVIPCSRGHIIVCIVGWVKSVVETLKKLPTFQCTDWHSFVKWIFAIFNTRAALLLQHRSIQKVCYLYVNMPNACTWLWFIKYNCNIMTRKLVFWKSILDGTVSYFHNQLLNLQLFSLLYHISSHK